MKLGNKSNNLKSFPGCNILQSFNLKLNNFKMLTKKTIGTKKNLLTSLPICFQL